MEHMASPAGDLLENGALG
uniref:Uncharacterized protein n=1 Tax=Arundo donax TaxID=35708 RepID=A0A0A9ELC0_ARUDO